MCVCMFVRSTALVCAYVLYGRVCVCVCVYPGILNLEGAAAGIDVGSIQRQLGLLGVNHRLKCQQAR